MHLGGERVIPLHSHRREKYCLQVRKIKPRVESVPSLARAKASAPSVARPPSARRDCRARRQMLAGHGPQHPGTSYHVRCRARSEQRGSALPPGKGAAPRGASRRAHPAEIMSAFFVPSQGGMTSIRPKDGRTRTLQLDPPWFSSHPVEGSTTLGPLSSSREDRGERTTTNNHNRLSNKNTRRRPLLIGCLQVDFAEVVGASISRGTVT